MIDTNAVRTDLLEKVSMPLIAARVTLVSVVQQTLEALSKTNEFNTATMALGWWFDNSLKIDHDIKLALKAIEDVRVTLLGKS